MKKKQKSIKQNIIIPKKAMLGIALLFPIVGILLSKNNPEGLILVGIGVVSGFFIAKGYFEK